MPLLPKHERLTKALRSGIEIRMGESCPGEERPYRVILAEDESGSECYAMIAISERIDAPETRTEVLLELDDSVFRMWAEQMTDEEVFGYCASSTLRQIHEGRWRGRSAN